MLTGPFHRARAYRQSRVPGRLVVDAAPVAFHITQQRLRALAHCRLARAHPLQGPHHIPDPVCEPGRQFLLHPIFGTLRSLGVELRGELVQMLTEVIVIEAWPHARKVLGGHGLNPCRTIPHHLGDWEPLLASLADDGFDTLPRCLRRAQHADVAPRPRA